MLIYFIMIFLWAIGYTWVKGYDSKNLILRKKVYFTYATILLTLVMGLKKYTVGADWKQYLYVYRNLIPNMDIKDMLGSGRVGFYGLVSLFHRMGVSEQGYIFIAAVILSVGFGYFFYKYSDNLFLSFYLHITIGMFTMSMSGIRQSIAVIIALVAFIYIEKKKYKISMLLILLAASFHASAIIFCVVYICMRPKITFKRGIILWILVASSLFYRKLLVPVVAFLTPTEYQTKTQLLSDEYPINPMLVVIALAIPLACLFCQKFLQERENAMNKRWFSIFYILSCVSAFCTVMSLNSNILGRVGFYFQSFSIVLISNTVSGIRTRKNRLIAYLIAFALPMVQFVMSTPGGTLRIDKYLFFWQ